jgi:hypothetical protein
VTASGWVIGYQNFTHLVSLFLLWIKLLQASKLMQQVSKKLQNYSVLLDGGSLNASRCVNFKLYVMENSLFKPLLTSYKIALKLFWNLSRE